MKMLPDLLKPNLKIVFCGMAAGSRSAKLGTYYAGVGNRFWKALFDAGLTPYLIKPRDFKILINYGIGLTDLVKNGSGNDVDVEVTPEDIQVLRDKINKYQPQILAFVGKKAAQSF